MLENAKTATTVTIHTVRSRANRSNDVTGAVAFEEEAMLSESASSVSAKPPASPSFMRPVKSVALAAGGSRLKTTATATIAIKLPAARAKKTDLKPSCLNSKPPIAGPIM
jgi:hypothetical protein